jgi:starch-binding outer membrane protein, SusD/RagB family
MKRINIKSITVALLLALTAGSCTKDLDKSPVNDITADQVYATAAGYKQVFAKVYGSYATTGNIGPTGSGDVQGLNEGTNADFVRTFWKAQELSTDEAVIAWGDAGIQDFHNMNWSSLNPFLQGLYYRSIYQITLVNEFLRQSTDEMLSSRNITGTDAEDIRKYRNEVRFLRAFQYWVLMDIFGNPPFVTETSQIAGAPPAQIKRADLFNYIEAELKAIEPNMAAPKTNEYGRADKAAVWALLARLYLNAQVYTGTAKYTEAVTYAKNVINAGYSLTSRYNYLLRADNNLNTNEFILTINYDGLKTQSDGGTNFLIKASLGGSMPTADFGVNAAWGGLRTTSALVNKFTDYSGNTDKRAQFYQNGQTLEIDNVSQFTQGFAVTKYRNVTRTGAQGQTQSFVDVDFPLFRLAEMYFIYAEAVLRGGSGGDRATALGYMNLLRQRAYENNSGNILDADLTLDYILNERARELYWEGFRRTDLIRYNRFTESTYLWPWKGGAKNGTGVDSYRKLYPLPSVDLTSNPNLVQNPGY